MQTRAASIAALVAVLSLCCGLSSAAAFQRSSVPQCVQLDADNLTWRFIAANNGTQCFDAPAYGLYNASRFQIGWDQLTLETAPEYPDSLQAYAAGFFEGAATKDVVIEFYDNMIAPGPFSPNISTFFEEHLAWVGSMLSARNASSDPMWVQVGLMVHQFEGFLDGLNSQISNPTQKFTKLMLLFVASQGDLVDLTGKFPYTPQSNDWRNMSKHNFELWLGKNSHCSSFVRIPEDRSDLIFAHATWQSFTFALRIYKTLTFRYHSAVMQTIQFTSYPATFVSTDDFHVLDTQLVVMETSLNVFNMTIYDHVVPQSLLSWMRVMVANRLAVDGASWQSTFSRYNSGTYNNQWMVVDMRRFVPGMHRDNIPFGVLTIVEQMPGWIIGRDMTQFLTYGQGNSGYWPSYNVPYFTELFDYAGYPEAIAQQGTEMLDYNHCVRAQIFRQRAPNVSTVEDAKFLIQYNDYQHDPISQGNPLYAIASRVDLTPPSIGQAQGFGAIDAKVSSYKCFHQNQQIFAFSGPTPQQQVFSFLTSNATLSGPHAGVPSTFNFTFQMFQL